MSGICSGAENRKRRQRTIGKLLKIDIYNAFRWFLVTYIKHSVTASNANPVTDKNGETEKQNTDFQVNN